MSAGAIDGWGFGVLPEAAPAEAEAEAEEEFSYIPAASFEGAREGYLFTTCDGVTGYWQDPYFMPEPQQQSEFPEPQQEQQQQEDAKDFGYSPQRQEEDGDLGSSPTSEAEVWTSPPDARGTRISENDREAADDAGVYDSLESTGGVGEWEQPDDEMTSGGGMTSGPISFERGPSVGSLGGQVAMDSGSSSPGMDGNSKSRRTRFEFPSKGGSSEGFGQELTNTVEISGDRSPATEPRMTGGGYAVQ